jgi:hypothetical protein
MASIFKILFFCVHISRCALCRQPYYEPRILPCGGLHTLCSHCLQYLTVVWPQVPGNDGDRPTIFCPVCTELVVLPETGVQGFKVSVHHKLVKYEGISQKLNVCMCVYVGVFVCVCVCVCVFVGVRACVHILYSYQYTSI